MVQVAWADPGFGAYVRNAFVGAPI